MLILLEGPDYAGKSTFAQKLHDVWLAGWGLDFKSKRTAEILHCGPPGNKPDELTEAQWGYDIAKDLIDTVNAKHNPGDPDHLLILDRYHIGMPVYGPLFRPQWNRDNYGDIGYMNFMWIENELHRHGGLTVHMATSLGTLIERSANREDEYLDTRDISRRQQLEEIWVKYYQFFAYVGQFMPTSLGFPLFAQPHETRLLAQMIDENPSRYENPWPEPYPGALYTYTVGGIGLPDVANKSVNVAASMLLTQARIKSMTRPYSEQSYRFNHSPVEAVK